MRIVGAVCGKVCNKSLYELVSLVNDHLNVTELWLSLTTVVSKQGVLFSGKTRFGTPGLPVFATRLFEQLKIVIKNKICSISQF